MNAASPTGMVGVKLTDIPILIRRRYGRPLAARMMSDGQGGDVYKLMLDVSGVEVAIEDPSDQVYFVSREAFEKASAKWVR